MKLHELESFPHPQKNQYEYKFRAEENQRRHRESQRPVPISSLRNTYWVNIILRKYNCLYFLTSVDLLAVTSEPYSVITVNKLHYFGILLNVSRLVV